MLVLSDRYAEPGCEIKGGPVLNDPPGEPEQMIDLLSASAFNVEAIPGSRVSSRSKFIPLGKDC